MVGEIVSKLCNALGGFWDSLDDQERGAVVYFGLYLSVSLLVSAQTRSRERLKRELRDELAADAAGGVMVVRGRS